MMYRNMTKRSNLASFLSILWLCSCVISSKDADNLGRHLQDNDFVCPFAQEERLYYNIDIYIEGLADNCVDYDLIGIGGILQNLVNQVEEEIPEYKDTEKMETIVCPIPLEEDIDRRRRRLEANQQQTKPRKKKRRGRKRYTYKGSGRCRRCKANNSDRRLQASPEICDAADMATYATSIASVAADNAEQVAIDLKQYVLENCEYTNTSGLGTILDANVWIDEIRESLRTARLEAKRSRSQCQRSKRASDSVQEEVVRDGHVSNAAMDAAEDARMRFFLLNEMLSADICNQALVFDNDDISVQSVCYQADLAECGVELAALAVSNGKDLLLELMELAMECGNLGSAQGLVMDAKVTLHEMSQAHNIAQTTYQNVEYQCQLAQEALPESDLMPFMKETQDKLSVVLDMVERADKGRLELSDIVKRMNICDSPALLMTNDVSVQAVCDRSDAASFYADVALAICNDANDAFTVLQDRALQCSDLESGLMWIVRANEFLSLCIEEEEEIRQQADLAAAQCSNAKDARSENELKEYLQTAESAFHAIQSATEDAKERYASIRDEEEKDICSHGAHVDNTRPSVESICEKAESATFASGMVTTAVNRANEVFMSVHNKAMECDDLSLGQGLATESSQWLKRVQQSQRVATKGARRALLECKKASRIKSLRGLRKSFAKAKRFAISALKAAERARTNQLHLEGIVGSLVCIKYDVGRMYEGSNTTENGLEMWYEYDEDEETYGEDESFSYVEEGNLDSDSPLRLWLVKLSDTLHERIPPEVLNAYGSSKDPNGCTLDAVIGYVDIDAFYQIDDRDNWIAGTEDCNATYT